MTSFSGGYIGIQREFLQEPLWKALNVKYKSLFITLLHRANCKRVRIYQGRSFFVLKVGQIHAFKDMFSYICNKHLTSADIKNGLRMLEKKGFICMEKKFGKDLITIANAERFEFVGNDV